MSYDNEASTINTKLKSVFGNVTFEVSQAVNMIDEVESTQYVMFLCVEAISPMAYKVPMLLYQLLVCNIES